MDVCVIGGSRYFGRRLVEQLRDEGAAVTVVNRGALPPPQGVTHLRADRNDEQALRSALAGRRFDVVVDQVCYTPLQAVLATRVFAGCTARYVMTSTVEVYNTAGRREPVSLPEGAVDPATWPVDLELPWQDEQFAAGRYGEGKRQAEAVLTREESFDVTTVRLAHVLGGADFTGRLDHYFERMVNGLPVEVHAEPQPASFAHEPEVARFLSWAARSHFTGPVNLASRGTLDVRELCALIGRVTGSAPEFVVTPAAAVSPFSFDTCYAMDTGRAAALGFDLSAVTDWLPEVLEGARR